MGNPEILQGLDLYELRGRIPKNFDVKFNKQKNKIEISDSTVTDHLHSKWNESYRIKGIVLV